MRNPGAEIIGTRRDDARQRVIFQDENTAMTIGRLPYLPDYSVRITTRRGYGDVRFELYATGDVASRQRPLGECRGYAEASTEVNWSACGSQGLDTTVAYAHLLIYAAQYMREHGNSLIDKPTD